MAGGPSVYVANLLLNKSLKGSDFTPPATFYAALLCTASETNLRGDAIASASEVANAGAYVRKPVTASQITTSTTGQSQISVDILYDAATGAWGTIYQIALMDVVTWNAGHVWYFGPLSSSAPIQTGDILKIPAATFLINL